MSLLGKLLGCADRKHVNEEQTEIEQRMDELSREMDSITKSIDKRYIDAFYVIRDSEKGDRHPLFPNLKLHQYDIDYAKKLVDRLENHEHQREE